MRKPVNIGASIRARLQNLARERGQPFQVLLTRFVLERLLYRLSLTAHSDRFVLKGAMLITSWFKDPLRPTQDLDLLGFGDPDADGMVTIFREVLRAGEHLLISSDGLARGHTNSVWDEIVALTGDPRSRLERGNDAIAVRLLDDVATAIDARHEGGGLLDDNLSLIIMAVG